MKNKHLRNPYHAEREAAPLSATQQLNAQVLAMESKYRAEAKRVEKELKGIFLTKVFEQLNLMKYR